MGYAIEQCSYNYRLNDLCGADYTPSGSTVSYSYWFQITPNSGTTATTYTVSGLTNGTNYAFRVAAVTAASLTTPSVCPARSTAKRRGKNGRSHPCGGPIWMPVRFASAARMAHRCSPLLVEQVTAARVHELFRHRGATGVKRYDFESVSVGGTNVVRYRCDECGSRAPRCGGSLPPSRRSSRPHSIPRRWAARRARRHRHRHHRAGG